MQSDNRLLTKLKLEFAYFAGAAWWGDIGRDAAGAILRFQRVRPSSSAAFQPLKADEITPVFLDRTIAALKRWGYDIVGIDEVCRRAVTRPQRRRFVCLSFDTASKDFITHGYPVLARHRVPFAVYVPTAFPDGVGEAWWLALEAIVAAETRLSLVIDRDERHFSIRSVAEKNAVFAYLYDWLRRLPLHEASTAINDLCSRYDVDIRQLSRTTFMNWADLAGLATDPNVSFGTATVNYAMLSHLADVAARREISMGKAVAETALGREVRHFAYPFGDAGSWRRAHVAMTEEFGFTSAVSAVPGLVAAEGGTSLHALPRITWDGRCRSLRAMRVLLSGIGLPPIRRRPADGGV